MGAVVSARSRPATLAEIATLSERVKAAQRLADELRAELVAAVRSSPASQAEVARAARLSRQRVGQLLSKERA
jgi:hypothetical protein